MVLHLFNTPCYTFLKTAFSVPLVTQILKLPSLSLSLSLSLSPYVTDKYIYRDTVLLDVHHVTL